MPITTTIELTQLACWNCGICYAVPAKWLDLRRVNGKDVCCPNGHKAAFDRAAKVDDVKLREIHDREQQEARDAEAAATATQGTTDKPKRRGRKPAAERGGDHAA